MPGSGAWASGGHTLTTFGKTYKTSFWRPDSVRYAVVRVGDRRIAQDADGNGLARNHSVQGKSTLDRSARHEPL